MIFKFEIPHFPVNQAGPPQPVSQQQLEFWNLKPIPSRRGAQTPGTACRNVAGHRVMVPHPPIGNPKFKYLIYQFNFILLILL